MNEKGYMRICQQLEEHCFEVSLGNDNISHKNLYANKPRKAIEHPTASNVVNPSPKMITLPMIVITSFETFESDMTTGLRPIKATEKRFRHNVNEQFNKITPGPRFFKSSSGAKPSKG